MIFTQKIIKIGNSSGIIIPNTLLKYLGWKAGSIVDVSYDPIRKVIIVKDKTGRGISITKQRVVERDKGL